MACVCNVYTENKHYFFFQKQTELEHDIILVTFGVLGLLNLRNNLSHLTFYSSCSLLLVLIHSASKGKKTLKLVQFCYCLIINTVLTARRIAYDLINQIIVIQHR